MWPLIIGAVSQATTQKYLRLFNDSGNSYVSFGDVNDCIGYPDITGQFYLSIDVYPLDNISEYILSTGGQTNSAGIALIKTSNTNFRLILKSGNISGGQKKWDLTNNSININQWNNIKVKWDGTNIIRFECNDIEVTKNSTYESNTNKAPLMVLGAPNNNLGVVNFNGYIKNLEIYEDYNKTNLWGKWAMLEGSGCTLFDESLNNRNGVLMPNCPTISPVWEEIL